MINSWGHSTRFSGAVYGASKGRYIDALASAFIWLPQLLHLKCLLVRLHRETQGAAYTGLMPAGSATPIVQMADNSVAQGRAYVVAYVDYTHTLEAIEAVLAHGGHH